MEMWELKIRWNPSQMDVWNVSNYNRLVGASMENIIFFSTKMLHHRLNETHCFHGNYRLSASSFFFFFFFTPPSAQAFLWTMSWFDLFIFLPSNTCCHLWRHALPSHHTISFLNFPDRTLCSNIWKQKKMTENWSGKNKNKTDLPVTSVFIPSDFWDANRTLSFGCLFTFFNIYLFIIHLFTLKQLGAAAPPEIRLISSELLDSTAVGSLRKAFSRHPEKQLIQPTSYGRKDKFELYGWTVSIFLTSQSFV